MAESSWLSAGTTWHVDNSLPVNTIYYMSSSTNWVSYADNNLYDADFWENHEWCPNTQRWVDKDLVIDEGL